MISRHLPEAFPRATPAPSRRVSPVLFIAALASCGAAVSLAMAGCSSDDTVIEFIGVTDAAPPRLGLGLAQHAVGDAGSD